MVATWLETLSHVAASELDAAVSKAIRTIKFWPTPAELLAFIDETREAPSRLPAYHAGDNPPFEPTDEELASVSAACAVWRAKFAPAETWRERMDQWKPASQGGASAALRASAAARRARGEPA